MPLMWYVSSRQEARKSEEQANESAEKLSLRFGNVFPTLQFSKENANAYLVVTPKLFVWNTWIGRDAKYNKLRDQMLQTTTIWSAHNLEPRSLPSGIKGFFGCEACWGTRT